MIKENLFPNNLAGLFILPVDISKAYFSQEQGFEFP
jgi:hypothetical protein